jgi:hypothetical protein
MEYCAYSFVFESSNEYLYLKYERVAVGIVQGKFPKLHPYMMCASYLHCPSSGYGQRLYTKTHNAWDYI